ncbi:bacteriocin [Caproiciproducens sp. NJN-50]|uniref:family 1 encapsulin nanocompartment shell protein n=1 Tax=Acutalibacteraceae TaxID=3082771 RepID=UPI000FFE04A6|nr:MULTISPECIES: family 1 encapsulin nanocompartment shell protein [Acutalibacteraceae]QAT50276.1 bacteriocin [Caproiciproducens sp. NJN-50]
MSYLSRESSPVSAELWQEIDAAVVETARKALTGRRFLHIFGPLGIGVESISVDRTGEVEEVESEGFLSTNGRKYVEIPSVYNDFTLLARDLENSARLGFPTDLTEAVRAASICARLEDTFLYFGNPGLGYEGLMTAPGIQKIKRSDWKSGENAFADIAAGLEHFASSGIFGTYALSLSPDLYLDLQRIQPGTGLLEIDRVRKMLDGKVYQSTALGKEKAVLVCSEPANMDLVVGQDLSVAYLEQKDLNHRFRVLETILPRIKNNNAVVAFE